MNLLHAFAARHPIARDYGSRRLVATKTPAATPASASAPPAVRTSGTHVGTFAETLADCDGSRDSLVTAPKISTIAYSQSVKPERNMTAGTANRRSIAGDRSTSSSRARAHARDGAVARRDGRLNELADAGGSRFGAFCTPRNAQ